MRKTLAQRRRERRCEHEIADIVEADEKNARRVADMDASISRGVRVYVSTPEDV
jgi:hypothetical protein